MSQLPVSDFDTVRNYGVQTSINGMWREVAIVEATPFQIAELAKHVRSMGDDFHAERRTEAQADNARRRFERNGREVQADDRCGTCHRDAHRPGMGSFSFQPGANINESHHGHEYRAPEAE